MGIFSRLTDIIDSNINALLERAEDPEKMIRLIIQEMEDTLVEVRSTAARAIADRKGIERNLERIAAAQEEWQRKAEFALSKDRDDLAKGALLEGKKLGETAAALQTELAYIAETLAHGEADVVKLETKLTEAKAKQKPSVHAMKPLAPGFACAANSTTIVSRKPSPASRPWKRGWMRRRAKWNPTTLASARPWPAKSPSLRRPARSRRN